ncbi:MAG TPA: T9SS type A sorting domain-containing protein, partial [Ignavibacteria bacterium]|nr:T9SS type A sorting domain-containing protein [Ignavibacteria bacterium]
TLLYINPESSVELHNDKVITTEYEPGNYKFVIELDYDNAILELYEDNNSFELPFVVIKDTVTSISSAVVSANFDGYEIYDGDFVSPNPNIEILLDYSGTYELSDTTKFDIRLNQKRISFSQLSTTYETQNNRIIFSYKPQLDNGDYALSVSGENIRPANSDAAEYVRFFKVSNENKILYPYNYPNPFINETYFTFKLTKVPNELKIKIFTVAGRLIKEIEVKREELNFDFNRIYWDGRDADGDLIANGVYLYKIISYDDNETTTVTNKLAIVR